MVRMVTQILAGLMLLFGVATLFPKSYFEFRTGRKRKAILYLVLGCLALFFCFMAFYYAYLTLEIVH
jgi:zinc transporter ZupT